MFAKRCESDPKLLAPCVLRLLLLPLQKPATIGLLVDRRGLSACGRVYLDQQSVTRAGEGHG